MHSEAECSCGFKTKGDRRKGYKRHLPTCLAYKRFEAGMRKLKEKKLRETKGSIEDKP